METYLKLDNGLRLIVRENPGTATVAAVAALAVSYAEEPATGRGLRELLQLCVLASAPSSAEKGIVLDASTEPDCIVLSARGSDRHGKQVLQALLGLLGTSEFDKELIAGQQRLLRRLVEAQEEVASAAASRAGLAALYPAAADLLKPAAAYRPVAAAALTTFWRQVLKPNRLAIAVSGPLKTEEVRRAVEQATGAWVPGPDLTPPGPGRRGAARGIVRLHVGGEESAVWVGARGPRLDEEDYPVAIVAMMALAHGMGSRLFRRLRDELGTTYGVNGHVVAGQAWPHMYVIATCGAEDVGRVTAEIQRELERMAEEDLTAKELERARNMAVLNLEQVRMSNWQTVQYLGMLALLNPQAPAEGRAWAVLEEVARVEAMRLRRFFAEWWDRPSIVQVIGHGGD